MTITRSTSEPPPVKGERTPTPPPATVQDGWNDDRFLPRNVTHTSPPCPGTTEIKEEHRAKKAALHPGLSWTACYDDRCHVHLSEKQGNGWVPQKSSKERKEPARDMEWEITYDAEPGSDWAPPQLAKKERWPHKDLVKWQHCFRDNCSVHHWEKVDAGYYPRIVGKDGVLSKRDETHHKRRRTMRTRHEQEGGKTTSSDVERLEKEILGLREQLTRAAETVVLKDQQLIKLDNQYRALRRSECHVAQNLAQEQRAHEETKLDRNRLKWLMPELGGELWRKGSYEPKRLG